MNSRAGEGTADINTPVIRRDEENKNVNSVPIQTNNSASLGCSLTNQYSSFPLSVNQTMFLKQTGSYPAMRSHEEDTTVTPPNPQQYKCDLSLL